jgi:hypothetical protein
MNTNRFHRPSDGRRNDERPGLHRVPQCGPPSASRTPPSERAHTHAPSATSGFGSPYCTRVSLERKDPSETLPVATRASCLRDSLAARISRARFASAEDAGRGCFLQDAGAFSRLSPRGQMPISGGPALVPAVNLIAYLHPGPPARTHAPLHTLWPSLSLVSPLPTHGRDTQSPPSIPSFVHVTAGASSDRCSLERRLHAIRVACLSAERPMPMSSQEKLGIPCSVAAATQSFHIIATAPCALTADGPEKSVGMHAASEKASASTGFLPTAILCISLE